MQTAIATHIVGSLVGGNDFDAQRITAGDDGKQAVDIWISAGTVGQADTGGNSDLGNLETGAQTVVTT